MSLARNLRFGDGVNARNFLQKTSKPESDAPQVDQSANKPAPPATFATFAPMNEFIQPANTKNVLSNDIEIKGTLIFKSDMVLDGKVEGEISSPGTLTLGQNAEVHGEIKTHSVVIRGMVNGNVTVEDRCELRGEAQLVGDLKASRLVMEQDATLVGKSEVTPKKNLAGAARPAEVAKPA